MRRQAWTVIVASIGLGCGAWSTLADEPAASQPPEEAARVKSASSFGGRASNKASITGREIFLREWIPNDPRSHGGDGLGPVFNETSCVACHNQGGVGGGGAESKNVTLISAVRIPTQEELQRMEQAQIQRQHDHAKSLKIRSTDSLVEGIAAAIGSVIDESAKKLNQPQQPQAEKDKERQALLDALKEMHPGLAKTRSIVLHRSSTDGGYSEWRQRLIFGPRQFEQVLTSQSGRTAQRPQNFENDPTFLGQLFGRLVKSGAVTDHQPPREMLIEKFGGLVDAMTSHPSFRGQVGRHFDGDRTKRFGLQVSQRNTTALFGAGLIDSIADEVLVKASQKFHSEFPLVTGRVARLKDGKIGRFGWKAQKARLYDFTMTACAVELGLHVPDHAQAGSPQRPQYQPAGFDLNQDECDALVTYLKELPAPARATTDNSALRETLADGERLFEKVGCAACHTPQLGEVAGIFSDLLLHDMGSENGDTGSYGVFVPDASSSEAEDPLPELAQVPARVPEPQALQSIPWNMRGAASQEWRTPPLWGVRDSAPYLHDGRAKTLEQAIAIHGGEAHQAAVNFFRLSKDEQTRVLSFLRTLVAPDVAVAGTQ